MLPVVAWCEPWVQVNLRAIQLRGIPTEVQLNLGVAQLRCNSMFIV